jgi:beta-lactamase regulating signal transducer with metallopeptidase domain
VTSTPKPTLPKTVEAIKTSSVESPSETEAPEPITLTKLHSSIDWQRYVPYAVSLYFLGVIVMLGRLLLGLQGGQRLRKYSKPVDNPTILEALTLQVQALGLAFTPAIAYCKRVMLPTVVGILKPTILLPFSFTSGLRPEQVEMLLAHELAHIHRLDPLINVVQRVIEALLFFHPAVWFISRRIRIERENCCDDLVLEAGGTAAAYASSLVEMAQQTLRSTSQRLMLVEGLHAGSHPSQLRSRILRLIGPPKSHQFRLQHTWMIVLAFVLVVSIALASNLHQGIIQADTTAPEGEVGPTEQTGAQLLAPEITDGKLTAVGPKARTVELDPNAASLLKQYWRALEQSDWKTATTLCSVQVREEAAKYSSPEFFFKAVVPVGEILKRTGRSRIGYWPHHPKHFAYIFDVRISHKDLTRDAFWVWRVRKLEGETNWEIDFPAVPFKNWFSKEKEDINRVAKEREQRLKELTPKLKAVKTFLTSEREEFAIGEPIYFRLRLLNLGDSVLRYGDQQVAVNNSMTITGPDGEKVKYIAETVQTGRWHKIIKPGEMKTLFDRLDIAKQYDMKLPGQYNVQFNGNGLEVSVMKEKATDMDNPASFVHYPGKLPSNVVTITVRQAGKNRAGRITSHRGTFELNKQIPVNLDCPVVKDVWGRDQMPFKVKTVEFVEKDERLHCSVKVDGATAADGRFIIRVKIHGKESRYSAREVILGLREFLFETHCVYGYLPAFFSEVEKLDLGPIEQFRYAAAFEVQIENIPAAAKTADQRPNVTTFRGAFKKGEPMPVKLDCPVVKDPWGNDQKPFKVETVEFVERDERLHCSVKIDGATAADGKFIIRAKIYGRESRYSTREVILGLRGFLFETHCEISGLPLLIREVQDLDFDSIHKFANATSFEVEIEDITRKAKPRELKPATPALSGSRLTAIGP